MKSGLSPVGTRVLYALAAWHVVVFVYIVASLFINGLLPSMFFQSPKDTFADFFYTTYWAYHEERYTDWHAVHPPFVFLIGDLISVSECHISPFHDEGRAGCGIYSLYLMNAIALVGAYLNAKLFSEDRGVRFLCFIVIASSFPFLFAMERGNYILFTYFFLVLSVSTQNKVAQGFFLACALNIKQYLIGLLGYAVLNRNYLVLISCAVSTVALTAAAAVYVPVPDYLGFIDNMLGFVDPDILGNLQRLPHSITVDCFIAFSRTAFAQYFFDVLAEMYPFATADLMGMYANFLEVIVFTSVAVVGVRLLMLHKQLSPGYFAFASLMCLFNLSEATGPYALILVLPYLPTIIPFLSRKELFALFLLFQPFDLPLLEFGDAEPELSYFTDQTVPVPLGLNYGSIFRPGAMLFLLVSTALRLVMWKTAAGAAARSAQAGAAPTAA